MPTFQRLGRLAAVVLACLLLTASAAGAVAPNPFRIWNSEMKRHGDEKKHPATGVGSCTLVNTDPGESSSTAKAVYRRTGQINFVPDGYDCYGAKFAKFGVEFHRFPQPKDFRIKNRATVAHATTCVEGAFCRDLRAHALAPSAAVNPTAAYFPPFTHVVIIYHENHTFDDYLGDCASMYAGCTGVVQSTNHISSVPDLHKMADRREPERVAGR